MFSADCTTGETTLLYYTTEQVFMIGSGTQNSPRALPPPLLSVCCLVCCLVAVLSYRNTAVLSMVASRSSTGSGGGGEGGLSRHIHTHTDTPGTIQKFWCISVCLGGWPMWGVVFLPSLLPPLLPLPPSLPLLVACGWTGKQTGCRTLPLYVCFTRLTEFCLI